MYLFVSSNHWQKDIYKSIQQALVKSTSCMLDIHIYIYVLLLRRVCGQIGGHSLSLLTQFVAKVQGRPIETACRLTCQPVEFQENSGRWMWSSHQNNFSKWMSTPYCSMAMGTHLPTKLVMLSLFLLKHPFGAIVWSRIRVWKLMLRVPNLLPYRCGQTAPESCHLLISSALECAEHKLFIATVGLPMYGSYIQYLGYA